MAKNGTATKKKVIKKSEITDQMIVDELKRRGYSWEESLTDLCSRSDQECVEGIRRRTVKINTTMGSGTGFILKSEDMHLFILTASHVLRKGNGRQSKIFRTLVRKTETPEIVRSPKTICAFYTKAYGDVAILKVKNDTKIFFPPIEMDQVVKRGSFVNVVDHRGEHTKTWRYEVSGFLPKTEQIRLHGKAIPGMSGSAIVSEKGKLVGVLITGQKYGTYAGKKEYTNGFYGLDQVIGYDPDFLVAIREKGSPYICKEEAVSVSSL